LLRALFASIPCHLHVGLEAYYHSIFYTVLSLRGFDFEVEVPTSRGRIDAVLELGDKVYVMEFKYVKAEQDTSPEAKKDSFEKALSEGMAQMQERGYVKKYTEPGKQVIMAAFAFLGRDDIEMQVDAGI